MHAATRWVVRSTFGRPIDAKDLEFDAVDVGEHAAIIAEDERVHRLLYVALTRATTRLSVVESTADTIRLVASGTAATPTPAADNGTVRWPTPSAGVRARPTD